jgi:site-specific recombinase XerD
LGLAKTLLALKKQSEENAKLFGKEYQKSDYVFVWPDGKPFTPDYAWRSFKRVMRDNGMKEMRFHDLRHSTASILYDKGWHIKDIQEWLRHADIAVTGNIYTHITQSRKQALAKDMEDTLRL